MGAGRIRRIEKPARESLPATPEAWLRELAGPTLLRVPGSDPSRCRAVTTLLHGNEPSGLKAVHAWLRAGAKPAVDVLFFLGAVEAALSPPPWSHRFLPGRRDLNRCFAAPFEAGEGEIAGELLDALREAGPEALVDIHNNTGHNPSYGVGPRDGPAELELVAFFARRYVHSDLRLGAIVEATQDDFPSVTVECGRAGDPGADALALGGLERLLGRERLGAAEVDPNGMEILTAPVRVCMAPGARLAFGEGPAPGADLTVTGDVDRHNFETLAPGTTIGWLSPGAGWPVRALGPEGVDVSRELFAARGGYLETRHPLIPIMMTTNTEVALADCLFYVVRRGETRAGRDGAP